MHLDCPTTDRIVCKSWPSTPPLATVAADVPNSGRSHLAFWRPSHAIPSAVSVVSVVFVVWVLKDKNPKVLGAERQELEGLGC